jgi:hypothetical protein
LFLFCFPFPAASEDKASESAQKNSDKSSDDSFLLANGNFVRITFSGGLSPYVRVSYDLTIRAEMLVVTHSKTFPCYDTPLQQVEMTSKDKALHIFKLIHEANLSQFASGSRKKEQNSVEFWASIGRDWIRFEVSEDQASQNKILRNLIHEIKSLCFDVAGHIPFRNLFFPSQKMGFLTVISSPSGKVLIDGSDTGETTPLHTYELEEGEYNVEVISFDGKFKNSFRAKILSKMTSRYEIELNQ